MSWDFLLFLLCFITQVRAVLGNTDHASNNVVICTVGRPAEQTSALDYAGSLAGHHHVRGEPQPRAASPCVDLNCISETSHSARCSSSACPTLRTTSSTRMTPRTRSTSGW